MSKQDLRSATASNANMGKSTTSVPNYNNNSDPVPSKSTTSSPSVAQPPSKPHSRRQSAAAAQDLTNAEGGVTHISADQVRISITGLKQTDEGRPTGRDVRRRSIAAEQQQKVSPEAATRSPQSRRTSVPTAVAAIAGTGSFAGEVSPSSATAVIAGNQVSPENEQNALAADAIQAAAPALTPTTPPPPPEPVYEYETSELTDKPFVQRGFSYDADCLAPRFSIGLDVHKYDNLVLLSATELAFSAGTFVVVHDFSDRQQRFIRCTGGMSVGHIAAHPARQFVAVAERGENSYINVYDYPAFDIVRRLFDETTSATGYEYVTFDMEGDLIASLSVPPEPKLTIWRWREEKIALRGDAFSQRVYRVEFSSRITGNLTSCGIGHIRFWNMAHTFTGWKLKSSFGKFGHYDFCDVHAVVELPRTGKVLTGSSWGSLLVWDDVEIQFEIRREGNRPCHDGTVVYFYLTEGQLATFGADGWIRTWDVETIEAADPEGEAWSMKLEPVEEVRLGKMSYPTYVVDNGDLLPPPPSTNNRNEEKPAVEPQWICQDAGGAVWLMNTPWSSNFADHSPQRLLTFHCRPVNGLSMCSNGTFAVTVADDRRLLVTDISTHIVVAEYVAPNPKSVPTAVLWAPVELDSSCGFIYCGYSDGILRILSFVYRQQSSTSAKNNADNVAKRSTAAGNEEIMVYDLLLCELLRPHTDRIIAIQYNNQTRTMYTACSDASVFFLQVRSSTELVPLGYVQLPCEIVGVFVYSHIPVFASVNNRASKLLVYCKTGYVIELTEPEWNNIDTSRSFRLDPAAVQCRSLRVKPVKRRLRRREKQQRKLADRAARKKQREDARKERQLKRQQALMSRGVDRGGAPPTAGGPPEPPGAANDESSTPFAEGEQEEEQTEEEDDDEGEDEESGDEDDNSSGTTTTNDSASPTPTATPVNDKLVQKSPKSSSTMTSDNVSSQTPQVSKSPTAENKTDSKDPATVAMLAELVTGGIPQPPQAGDVTFVIPCLTDSDFIWVALAGEDTGYLYKCRLSPSSATSTEGNVPYNELPSPRRPDDAVLIPPEGNDFGVTCFAFSLQGAAIVFGMSDGTLRVHELKQQYNVDSLAAGSSSLYWQWRIHAFECGPVQHVAFSCDFYSLMSAGADGNVYIFDAFKLFDRRFVRKTPVAAVNELPLRMADEVRVIEDVVESNEVKSVEDVRLNEDTKRLRREGEDRKRQVRTKLKELRKQFDEWMLNFRDLLPDMLDEQIIRLPQIQQLFPSDVTQGVQEAVVEAHREVKDAVVFEKFKTQLMLQRLRSVFESDLDATYRYVAVKAFHSSTLVENYRYEQPSPEWLHIINIMHEDELRRAQAAEAERITRGEGKPIAPVLDAATIAAQRHSMAERAAAGFLVDEPVASGDDGDDLNNTGRNRKELKVDVASIRHAIAVLRDTLGDYKMKSSPEYALSNKENIRALKRLLDLVEMHKRTCEIRTLFNERVELLRKEKVRLCKYINHLREIMLTIRLVLPKVAQQQTTTSTGAAAGDAGIGALPDKVNVLRSELGGAVNSQPCFNELYAFKHDVLLPQYEPELDLWKWLHTQAQQVKQEHGMFRTAHHTAGANTSGGSGGGRSGGGGGGHLASEHKPRHFALNYITLACHPKLFNQICLLDQVAELGGGDGGGLQPPGMRVNSIQQLIGSGQLPSRMFTANSPAPARNTGANATQSLFHKNSRLFQRDVMSSANNNTSAMKVDVRRLFGGGGASSVNTVSSNIAGSGSMMMAAMLGSGGSSTTYQDIIVSLMREVDPKQRLNLLRTVVRRDRVRYEQLKRQANAWIRVHCDETNSIDYEMWERRFRTYYMNNSPIASGLPEPRSTLGSGGSSGGGDAGTLRHDLWRSPLALRREQYKMFATTCGATTTTHAEFDQQVDTRIQKLRHAFYVEDLSVRFDAYRRRQFLKRIARYWHQTYKCFTSSSTSATDNSSAGGLRPFGGGGTFSELGSTVSLSSVGTRESLISHDTMLTANTNITLATAGGGGEGSGSSQQHRGEESALKYAQKRQAMRLLIESKHNVDSAMEWKNAMLAHVVRCCSDAQIGLLKKYYQLLEEEISRLQALFDAKVTLLFKDKAKLDAELSKSRMLSKVMFWEFVIMKNLETQEKIIQGRVDQSLDLRAELLKQNAEMRDELQAGKTQLDELKIREKEVLQQFEAIVQQFNPKDRFFTLLTKLFKKKVKKSKKKKSVVATDGADVGENGTPVEPEEEEDEEEDDEDDDDDLDEVEWNWNDSEEDITKNFALNDVMNLDECPAGLDPAVFDAVGELRHRRAECEERTADNKRALDNAQRVYDITERKLRQSKVEVDNAKKELDEFQYVKMQKINELPNMFMVTMNQIFYHEQNDIPRNLSQAIVFQVTHLDRIRDRIREVAQQARQEATKHQPLAQRLMIVRRQKKLLLAKIHNLNIEVHENMLKKFGQRIDLDGVEDLADELKLQLSAVTNGSDVAEREQREHFKRLYEIDQDIRGCYKEMTNMKVESSRRMNEIVGLMQEKKVLERAVQAQYDSMGTGYIDVGVTDNDREQQEIGLLDQLVVDQSKEIAGLRREIGLYGLKTVPRSDLVFIAGKRAVGRDPFAQLPRRAAAATQQQQAMAVDVDVAKTLSKQMNVRSMRMLDRSIGAGSVSPVQAIVRKKKKPNVDPGVVAATNNSV